MNKNYSKLKCFMLALFFICCNHLMNAQELEWAKKWEPTLYLNYHILVSGFGDNNGIISDNSGNFYFRGNFTGTFDMDINANTSNLTSIGTQANNFLSKYNAMGEFLWAKSITSSPDNKMAYVNKMATDVSGNLLTTGYFGYNGGKIDFDPGTGPSDTFYLTTPQQSAFLSKLDSAGNFLWAKSVVSIVPEDPTQGFDVIADSDGNVYTTVTFSGPITIDTFNLTQVRPGFENLGVVKMNSSGDITWTRTIGGSFYSNGRYVTVDDNDNVYVMGNFKDSLFLKADNTVTNILNSPDEFNVFIIKLNSSGNFLWAQKMPGTYDLTKLTFSNDAAGNLYLSGRFNTQAVLGNDTLERNNFDAFVSKLDHSGNFLWAKQMGAVNSDDDFVGAIIKPSGIYVSGNFNDTATFGSLQLIPDLEFNGRNIFYTKLDTAGNFIWAKQIGGKQDDFAAAITGSHNFVYTFGSFKDTVDFDPGATNYPLDGAATSSLFISKMSLCTSTSDTITLNACGNYIFGGQTYTQSGTYTHTFANVENCDSVVTLHLAINTVDNSVTQSATTLLANQAGAVYQWIDCANGNTPVSGATNQHFNPSSNGSYAVIVTKNGCSDTSVCYTIAGLGINEFGEGNKVNIYPNPTNGEITIAITAPVYNADISLINIVGQTIVEKSKLSGSTFNLNMKEYAAGVYIVEIREGDKTLRLKVVKE
jgi:hypothetical protein